MRKVRKGQNLTFTRPNVPFLDKLTAKTQSEEREDKGLSLVQNARNEPEEHKRKNEQFNEELSHNLSHETKKTTINGSKNLNALSFCDSDEEEEED